MLNGFLAELKRRNMYRAAVLYAAAAWLLVQVATQIFPYFAMPSWVVRWIVVAAAIGFPLWIAFVWFYEFTPQGLKRESEVARGKSIARATGRKIDVWIIAVLAVAVALLLTNQFVLRGDATSMASKQAVADKLAKTPSKSIAVLPLANASGDSAQQYFSDGLSEDLITALAQFDGLKVISRNSSFQFRDSKESASSIGAKLGVAHLLEGSVRQLGNTVRITAQLVNAADASTLWSQHYDRPYQDLFALQDEITHAVAGELKSQLMPGVVVQGEHPPSGNLDAYNAYLQGQFYVARNTEDDQRTAIDAYAKATRLDPRYAQAWAALASAWTGLATSFLAGDPAQDAYATARNAAHVALTLDPNLAVAHGVLGTLFLTADLNWTAAQAEYRKAADLAPNDPAAKHRLATLMATLGRPDTAVDLARQALAADPLNADTNYWLAKYLLALGRLDEAAQVIARAIELQPDAAGNFETVTAIEIQRGNAGAALAAAKEEPPGPWQDIALALALQIGDDQAAADQALQHLKDTLALGAAYQIAQVYALRKDPDEMFAWLDRAWVNRDPGVGDLLFDPFLMPYRNDPRFAAFGDKAGLPRPSASAHDASGRVPTTNSAP